jgi:prevent-host-death family protein
MRFVTVRELRSKSAEVWRRLSHEGELVVTSNGRPIAILMPTDDRTLEDSLKQVRAAQAARAMALLQRGSTRRGTDRLSLAAINAEISAARRERRK